MDFVRKVVNSNVLADIIEIPEHLKNKKVEIIILPYDNVDNEDNFSVHKAKKARGLLQKYRNKELQSLENTAWEKAVIEKHESS